MHVHQLQDFAFGNDVGGLREDLHHAHVVGFDHHLESAGVQEIADQDTRGVAEGLVGCRAPTPEGGFVHHVIVEQCGRVDELDDRSEVETLAALVAEGATGQQQQHRSEPFAARGNDVPGHFTDERDARIQPARDDLVHFEHVVGDECQSVERGSGCCSQGGIHRKVAGL